MQGGPLAEYLFETDRTRVRRLTLADKDAVFALLSDPEVMRYVDDDQPKTRAQSDAYLERHLSHYETYGYGQFAVEDIESGAVIGLVGLVPPSTHGADVEIGYTLDKAVWGRGIGREVASAVLAWGITTFGFTSVVATVDPQNIASARIALGLGFTYERFELDEYVLPTDVYILRVGRGTPE